MPIDEKLGDPDCICQGTGLRRGICDTCGDQSEDWFGTRCVSCELEAAEAAHQQDLREMNAELEELAVDVRRLVAEHKRLRGALENIAVGNPNCCREAEVPRRGWCPKCIARAALNPEKPEES